MRRAAKGKQKGRFYRFLERIGLHNAIYTPMHMCREGAVKVYERMRGDGRGIWERSCRLTQQGTERGGDFQMSTGLLLFGRKKRFGLA